MLNIDPDVMMVEEISSMLLKAEKNLEKNVLNTSILHVCIIYTYILWKYKLWHIKSFKS